MDISQNYSCKKDDSDMTAPSQNFISITSDVSQPMAFKIPISFLSSALKPEALSQAKIMKAITAPEKNHNQYAAAPIKYRIISP